MHKKNFLFCCFVISLFWCACATAEKTPVSSELVSGTIETGSKSAKLTWEAPTTNTDGSPLTDLAGYNIYSGHTHRGPYVKEKELNLGAPGLDCIDINNEKGRKIKTECTYIIENLGDHTHHFVVTAFNKFYPPLGESAHSNEADK